MNIFAAVRNLLYRPQLSSSLSLHLRNGRTRPHLLATILASYGLMRWVQKICFFISMVLSIWGCLGAQSVLGSDSKGAEAKVAHSLSPFSSQPPTYNDVAYNDAVRTASIKARDLLLKEFKAHLSPEQLQILVDIDISISPSLEPYRAVATGVGAEKQVEISVGFMELLILFNDTMVFSEIADAPQKAWEYLSHITTVITGNAQATTSHQQKETVQSFLNFMGLSQAEERDWYSDKVVNAKREFMFVENFTLVLAHELAHHFYKHLDKEYSLETKRLNEAAADRFAVELAIRSGHQPFLAIFPYLLFIQLDEIFHVAPGASDHPKPSCRAGSIVESGIRAMKADKGFINHLRIRGEYDLWNQGMKTLRTTFRDHCRMTTS